MCVVLHWGKLVNSCSDHPEKPLQFKPRAKKPVQNENFFM